MSNRLHPTCAQPGCDERPPYGDEDYTVYGYTSYEDYVVANFDWQTIHNPDGTTTWYCPDHIHATCRKCGRTETNDIDTLNTEKWRNAGWANTMCPGCAHRTKQTKEDNHEL